MHCKWCKFVPLNIWAHIWSWKSFRSRTRLVFLPPPPPLSQCCRYGARRLFVQFSAGAPLASNHIPRLVTTSTLSNTSFQPSPQWVTSTTPTHHHQLLTSSVCNTCSTLLYLSLCWCWEDQHKEPIDRYKDHLDGQHLTHHTNLAKMRKWQLTILLKKFYRQMRREYCTKK